jgi:PhnB protein
MNDYKTRIAPMLAVRDSARAVEFYKQAFGAVELWRIGDGGAVVAGLSVNGAELFLAEESPPHGTRSPKSTGSTTVRIELIVENPEQVHARAVAAGATAISPVTEYKDPMVGPHPIRRIRQGDLLDPFGHHWIVGRIEM